jgi:hypothetical protein
MGRDVVLIFNPVTMYEVCTLDRPFPYRRTSSKQDIPALPTRCSEALRDFIFGCMLFDPTQRPPTTELHKIAGHEMELRSLFGVYSKYLRDIIGKNLELWDEIKHGEHSIGLQTLYKEDKDALISLLIGYENIRFYGSAILSESRY